MPRPTKLTPEVRKQILEALKLGCTRAHAAACGGVSERTLYGWLKRGTEEHRGTYVQFSQDVKKAEAECTQSMLKIIQDAAAKDWKAAAWCLERCRGYTRTNAVRLSVQDAKEPIHEQATEAREIILAKLEAIAAQS